MILYRSATFAILQVQNAADHLARESWNKWILEEGDVVDDITVEVIYLFRGTEEGSVAAAHV